jgi:uncharacterized protein (DUF111 family)
MATTEIMDIMLKVGVTEDVTSVFEEMSRVAEKVHGQIEKMTQSFHGVRGAVTGIATALGATGVGVIALIATAVACATQLDLAACAE